MRIFTFVFAPFFLLSTVLLSNVAAETRGAFDPVKIARALSGAFESTATRITPSLVSISSMRRQGNIAAASDPRLNQFRDFLGDELFKKYFGLPQTPGRPGQGPLVQHGLGSGFIISEDGYILTNNHVVQGADAVRVRLNDDREVDGTIVGSDPQTDIAVLKIEEKGLTPAAFGDSDTLGIGEWVVAAGSPFGLERSITAGIVSARGRSVSRGDMYEDFIQTDAAINVGNSGGPLLNLEGKVIGINTMILSRTGGNQGIGFAIPINMARNIADQLIKSGVVKRGWLGIAIQDLTEELRQSFDYQGRGVLVGDVNSGGPADRGGLQPGDIITTVNDIATEDTNELRNLIASIQPGTTVSLRVVRGGTQRDLAVELGDRPEDPMAPEDDQPEPDQGTASSALGFRLQSLDAAAKNQLGISSSGSVLVVDVEPHSPAYKAGLRQGDVILKVEQSPVASPTEFLEAVGKGDLGKGVRIVVENSGLKRFAILKKE